MGWVRTLVFSRTTVVIDIKSPIEICAENSFPFVHCIAHILIDKEL